MKKLTMMAAVALATAFGATETKAEEGGWAWSPMGIGLAAPIQLPWTTSDIYGLRLGSFFGMSKNVYGVDWTLVGLETGDMIGLQATAFSWTSGNVYGLQVGALANVTHEDLYGLQVAPVNVNFGEMACGLEIGAINYGLSCWGVQIGALANWCGSSTDGLQIGLVNADQEDFIGAAIGGVNYANRASGLQLGFFNLADDATGLQLGAINAAGTLRGIQIGAINLICDAKILPTMVIANVEF